MSESRSQSTPRAQEVRLRGQAVYLFAFDVAYEMKSRPTGTLLGYPLAEYAVDMSKRLPRYFFYRPQMVRLPPVERFSDRGLIRVERTVKVLPIGAVSIACRVRFDVPALGDLVHYHDLAFTNGTLQQDARQLAEDIQKELSPLFVRPVERLMEEEAYTVFCLESPTCGDDGGSIAAEAWLAQHRRAVAALLTQEETPEALSHQETEETTSIHLSYYGRDLAVVDWDAALLIDEPRNFEESLYLMELANLQLAELEAYDRMIDASLERSYRDLRAAGLKNRANVLRDLQELRIDLARFNDELSNITKFFGDWHLARLYQGLAARLHLSDWHKSIDRKLQTLDDLYAMLAHDRMNRLMLILEMTIVILFVLDLGMLFLKAK